LLSIGAPDMAGTQRTRDATGVCHVFLSHAGEQKKSYVDCLHQLLLREGGRGQRRNQCINVFMDQHSLKPGGTAWAVVEENVRNCRIGGAQEHGLVLFRSNCTPSAAFAHQMQTSCASCLQRITPANYERS
jgi:hypothetical protein